MQSKYFRWYAGMSCISLSMLAAQAAHAQIKVGVTISTTGPAAAIGAPTRNAMLLWPKEVAGQKVEYIILDDASDTTNAVRNLRKLTAEEKVDIVVGPQSYHRLPDLLCSDGSQGIPRLGAPGQLGQFVLRVPVRRQGGADGGDPARGGRGPPAR